MTDTFLHSLLSGLSLDEKIGQLHQHHIKNGQDLGFIRQGGAGSIINASGALTGIGESRSTGVDSCNYLQRLALESPHPIPLIFGRDVIHGYRTVFPIPLAQAASFNPGLAEEAASIAAREATADGIKWTFAPMLDIARDPRWGRIAEGNGEDPYLGARMAEAVVRGFQGNPSDPDRVVACAKHYIGYGAAEGGRDYENGEISDPTLRDVYLPPFEAAIRGGVGTVMSAFLDLNGMPVTASRYLLTDVLRNELGFDGFVVSDWESITELIPHGVAEDRSQAAALALHAGVDMDMVSGAYRDTLAENLHKGQITMEEIDRAVLRVLRIKQRAGLFENPFTDPERAQRDLLTPASRQVAREFARQTIVLLKNEKDILPLDASRFKRILFAGPFVHARSELFGTWTPDGRAEDTAPLDEAIRQVAPKDTELVFTEYPDRALWHAAYCDAAVLLVGEHPNRSGENANISDLTLPPGQAEWIEAMAAMNIPIVLVVFAGRPLALTRQINQVNALLYAWHPGIEGAAALGEILFGQVAPSARLPVTFPRATGQVPIYYNHKNSGRPIQTDGPFRSRYVDSPSQPLFPFGFGLGYTRFEYADLRLSSERLQGSLQVSAEVTNLGMRVGTEVVQLYVRDLIGSLTRPVRELKGFTRITLQPGETRRVTFTIDEEALAFTRADGSRGVEAGKFQVWIAPHSQGGLMGEFYL